MWLSLEKFLNRCFRKIGYQVGRRPWHFIAGTVIVCLALSAGILHFNFYTKPLDFYFSAHTRSLQDLRIIERVFPHNLSTEFDLTRTTRLDRFANLIILAKDGGSMLRKDLFTELLNLDRSIQNITIHQDGKDLVYSNMCAKNNDRCFNNEILSLYERLQDFEDGHYKFKYPVEYDYRSLTVKLYSLFLGGVELVHQDFVASAKAISLWYVLDFMNLQNDNMHMAWENKLVELCKSYRSDLLEIHCMASQSPSKEINAIILGIILYSIPVMLLILIFTMITSSSRNPVYSKAWVGVCGVAASLLGTGAAIGVGQMLGLIFEPFNVVILFVMVGITLDDTFVLLAAWRLTPASLDIAERTSRAYGRAGLAITITTVTNLLSFGLGATAPFQPTRLLCAYAAGCVAFCYVTTVTFYGSCLALFGRLEQRGRHGMWLWREVRENDSCCFEKVFVDKGPTACSQENGDLQTEKKEVDLPNNDDTKWNEWTGEMTFSKILDFLSTKFGIFLLILLYLLYLIPAIYGITIVDRDTNVKNFFRDDSDLYQYITMNEKYFSEYQMRLQIVIHRPLDYSDPKVQKQVEDLLTSIENIPLIADSSLTESWLRHVLKFKGFLSLWNYLFLTSGTSLDSKGFAHYVKNTFLRIPAFKRFSKDIVFDDDNSQIIASRFFVQSKKVNTYNNVLDIMSSLRQTIDNSSMPDAFAYYHMFLLYEHLDTVIPMTTNCILTALGVMLLCSFLLIPSFKFVVIIGVVVFSVELGIIGFMSLCGIKLITVYMVLIIVSVGFSVDNTAHVICAYLDSPKSQIREKILDAFKYIWFPIFQGYGSSVLALLVLLVVPTSIYLNCAILLFFVLTFSFLHSIFLVPILIMFVESWGNSSEPKEIKEKTTIPLKSDIKE